MADSDMIKGLNKAIDAATGKTGTDYTYLYTTPVTEKLDELAEAIANSGGGGGGGVPQVQSDWTETDTSSKAYILHKPTLATVATSGSYNDLSDKPVIPTGDRIFVEDELTAGQTSITLTDVLISSDSTFDFYTDIYGVAPKTVSVSTGSITLTFDAQASDMMVKVVIYNESNS